MFLERSQLSMLVAVRRHGSVTGAAAAEHITQSAASQRLREAERRLGVPLTEKRGRSVVLTSAAHHLVGVAERAERMLATAESEAVWIARSTTPGVRVALSVFDPAAWIVRASEALAGGPAIEVVRCDAAGPGPLLADGGADVVPVPTALAPAGFDTTPLAVDRLVCVSPLTDPLAASASVQPGDFSGTTYLTYGDRPESGFEYERFFAPSGELPDDIRRIESTTTILELVAAGQGVTILPAATTIGLSDRVAIRPLSTEVAVEWSLAWSRRRTDDTDVDAVTRAFRVAMATEAGA